MHFIDVHSHINSAGFDRDREKVLEEAEKAGVIYILDSGESLEENEKILQLAAQHKILKASLGFHPTNLSLVDAEENIEFISAHSLELTALGEVGLDYWYVKEHSQRKMQEEIFRGYIALAKELNKPLVVHSRSAGKYAIEVLKAEGAEQVCMHAFDGSSANALKGIELGYYFSIPASIVRSEQKQKLVKILPLENLLLETDSPILGPAPKERNVPANVKIAAGKIAEIKEISLEEVAETTTKNAKKLFGL